MKKNTAYIKYLLIFNLSISKNIGVSIRQILMYLVDERYAICLLFLNLY